MVRLYSDANIVKFNEQVGNMDWKDVYESVDTNIVYANFEQQLNTCFINSFPLVRLSRKHTKDKKWMSVMTYVMG